MGAGGLVRRRKRALPPFFPSLSGTERVGDSGIMSANTEIAAERGSGRKWRNW
jgi:hypothetical protein